MIKGVEEFGPELQRLALEKPGGLKNRNIEVELPGPVDNTRSAVAEVLLQDTEPEALRDLVRAREAAKKDQHSGYWGR